MKQDEVSLMFKKGGMINKSFINKSTPTFPEYNYDSNTKQFETLLPIYLDERVKEIINTRGNVNIFEKGEYFKVYVSFEITNSTKILEEIGCLLYKTEELIENNYYEVSSEEEYFKVINKEFEIIEVFVDKNNNKNKIENSDYPVVIKRINSESKLYSHGAYFTRCYKENGEYKYCKINGYVRRMFDNLPEDVAIKLLIGSYVNTITDLKDFLEDRIIESNYDNFIKIFNKKILRLFKVISIKN